MNDTPLSLADESDAELWQIAGAVLAELASRYPGRAHAAYRSLRTTASREARLACGWLAGICVAAMEASGAARVEYRRHDN